MSALDRPTPLIDLAARRTRGTGRLARLFGRVDQAATGAVIALTTDRPHDDASAIAAAVQAGSEHPAMRAGKGTHLRPVDDATAVADVLPIRPRKFKCWKCEAPATRLHESRVSNAEPIYACPECPPPGLRVVPGSGDVA